MCIIQMIIIIIIIYWTILYFKTLVNITVGKYKKLLF